MCVFRDGKKVVRKRVDLPIVVCGKHVMVRVSIVPGVTPLLLSSSVPALDLTDQKLEVCEGHYVLILLNDKHGASRRAVLTV